MNSALLALYHRLPHPLRSAAAVVRGRQLRAWRYGPETDRLVADAITRERWTADEWARWQRDRLERLLDRAGRQVPHYRRYWHHKGVEPSRHLADWPVLEKGSLRANALDFLADDADPRSMFPEHTSGTSGTPLDLWWSRQTVREWYALFEARYRLWYGVSRHDPWAILGGQLVVPFTRRRPPFWIWNPALHQLYLSSHHLASAWIPAYLDALAAHRVRYLWGYTSALFSLADEALRLGRRVPMHVAITNAEPLDDHQRSVIGAAFECPVRETYGMAEIAAAASECERGRLHAWPDAGVIEVRDDEGRFGARTGALICTGLVNREMPLIRYDVGDRITLPSPEAACDCGRTLPLVASIDGRSDDVLVTADGRRVGRLDTAFKRSLAIREAQIIQDADGSILVRYVPADGCGEHTTAALREALRERLGDLPIAFEALAAIPRASNGKFRAVIARRSAGVLTR